MKHLLLQHHLKVISGENEDMQPVHVRRKHIFEDAVRAFAKPSLDVSKILKREAIMKKLKFCFCIKSIFDMNCLYKNIKKKNLNHVNPVKNPLLYLVIYD